MDLGPSCSLFSTPGLEISKKSLSTMYPKDSKDAKILSHRRLTFPY